MGIYVAASIAGAGTGLSEVVLTGFVSLLVVACAVVMGSLGWSRFAAMVRGTPNPNPDPNPNPNPNPSPNQAHYSHAWLARQPGTYRLTEP